MLINVIMFIVSGEVIKQGVISKKSGHLFEKNLIEKVIATTNQCPITKNDLSIDDLIPIQGKLVY